jgi:uncharacterized protein (TIGR02453 family)
MQIVSTVFDDGERGHVMVFRGWKAEALEFFEGLEAENSKAYWERNKATYESLVRAPMDALVAELSPKTGGRIFRPYRDVRFSKDKSPYKTNIAAMVDDGYVQLSSHGLGAGAGMWEMAPDQLERYREAVDRKASGTKLEAIVTGIRDGGIQVTGHGVLKTAPRGYPKEHPRAELLRYKGLTAWRDWEPAAWLGTAKAKDRLVDFFTATRPLRRWLGSNVGGSDLPESRR